MPKSNYLLSYSTHAVFSSHLLSFSVALSNRSKPSLFSPELDYVMNTLTPTGIANLLGQTLHSRCLFPFYSFCVLAGIEKEGHAHVPVACAGNGKEMLQPILDRMFATVTKMTQDSDEMNDNERDSNAKFQRDGRAVHASKQRSGLKLEPPVETHITCNAQEALSMLVRGYRSVAEREISIGDNVVVAF